MAGEVFTEELRKTGPPSRRAVSEPRGSGHGRRMIKQEEREKQMRRPPAWRGAETSRIA